MGTECCSARDQTMDRQVSAAVYANKDVDKAVKMVFEHSSSFMVLNLRFACKNLASMDYFSDTDAFICVFELVNESWVERGRTEVVPNNLNPQFLKTIQIDYYFEREQVFRAIVSDSDQLDKDFVSLASANFIGDIEFKAQNLVCSKTKEIELALCNKDGHSDIKKGVINICLY